MSNTVTDAEVINDAESTQQHEERKDEEESEEEEEEQEFAVEKILKERITEDGHKEYLGA